MWEVFFSTRRGIDATPALVFALFIVVVLSLPAFLLWLQLKKGGYLYLVLGTVIYFLEGIFISAWLFT
jgi:hypothetical protein